MVWRKIKEVFSEDDSDKYEILYHKYSQLRLENNRLKENHKNDLHNTKVGIHAKVADHLVELYSDIEVMRNSSFKVHAKTKEIQRLMLDMNKVEKKAKELMKDFSLEEVMPEERFYDPELHEVASYEDAKGMAKGIIIKTVKRGFKYRGELIRKPRVVVTK